ncbi:MAG: peptidylprolyl isomerase [Gammaproteobacteria bacterium]
MKRWLREPLMHFLVAGGLLFAAYAWLDRDGADEARVVRITQAEVDWLRETWARQWQRPPSDDELRGIVAEYLKEGLLAREARELGLDDNDTIVRRRLAQKMEFLVQDTAVLAEPGEAQLRQFYDGNPARYQDLPRVTFTQIYFTGEEGARQGLRQLADRDPAELGDRSLLERDYAGLDQQAVANLFGGEFAAQLFALEPGRWAGPIASGYGFHLVRVRERGRAQPRPFEDVRAQVLADWQHARQAEISEQFFAELMKKYEVVVEPGVQPLLGSLVQAPQ